MPNDSVYPVYPETDADNVTQRRLSLAKWQATGLFQNGLQVAHRRFRDYAVRKYRCKPQQIRFDDKGAIQRIRRAVLFDDEPWLLGRTDGETIEICAACPMTHAEIVGTLLHEAMHDWCRVRGKFMSCANEHYCMSRCGDPYE